MDDKKTIKTIQDKLSQHRTAVPDSLWERVSKSLPAPVAWYKRKAFYGSAAAIAGILIAIYCLHGDNNSSMEKQEQHLCASCTQPQDSVYDELTCATVENIIEEEKIENTPKPSSVHIQRENTPSKSEVNTRQNNFIADNDNTTADTKEDKTSTKEVSDSFGVKTPPITYCDNNEQLYDDTALNDICKKCSNRKENSILFSFDATTSGERKVVTPMSFRCFEGELTFVHKMPFTMRAHVEKRYGRWGVGVGVSYTYMMANYQLSNYMRLGKQELHYIGIPLYASFEFARVGKFAFYTALGGQVDINTAGSHKELPKSNAYKYFDEMDFRDKKLQFSAQLRLGAAFEVTKHLDIFVEPMLGYYFANESKVHSIWHDAPLNASIALGVRTWF